MTVNRPLILFIAVLGLSGCMAKPVETVSVEHLYIADELSTAAWGDDDAGNAFRSDKVRDGSYHEEDWNDNVEDSEADTWREAYKTFLQDFIGDSRYNRFHYSWRDLDNNGIPELIIEEAKDEDGSLTVYSYDGGIFEIGNYLNPKIGTAALQFSSNPEFSGLFTLWWGGGVEHYGYLTVEDSRLKHVDLWYIDRLNESETEISGDKELITESKNIEATGNIFEMYSIDAVGIGVLYDGTGSYERRKKDSFY